MKNKFDKMYPIATAIILALVADFASATQSPPSPAHALNYDFGSYNKHNDGLYTEILPPASTLYGKSYANWSVKWWQWIFSLPASTFEKVFGAGPDACSVGQSGKVWFLVGEFGTPKPITRECTIPSGTALFFPIYNAWADNTACPEDTNFPIYPPDDHPDDASLSGFVQDFIDSPGTLSVSIDGKEVKGVSGLKPVDSPYLVGQNVFSYKLAKTPDNALVYLGPILNADTSCFADKSRYNKPIYPAVEDGVYLMVNKLSHGKHIIKLGDLIYKINVN